MHIRFFHILILASALLVADSALAQRKDKSQTPKEAAKDQAQLRKEREDKINAELTAKEKGHVSIQDKATRKRMKANRKRSKRIEKGKTVPFYKRWFMRRKIR